MLTATTVVLLVAVLGFAVVRPAGLSEGVLAVPVAVLTVLTGLVPWGDARAELIALAPTVLFLAAVLALAHLAGDWGVFGYLGAAAARWSGRSPGRLLTAVVGVAAGVTATLSLDATVTLLTPVVLSTCLRMGVRPHAHVYACTHLANSGSLLLPVSNLTNLLAFAATGLSFGRFAAVMALPWIVVVLVEWAVLARFFAGDLAHPARPDPHPSPPAPLFALVVLAVTLAGLALAEPAGVHPAVVAAVGAVVLAVPRVLRGVTGVTPVLRETQPGFCVFVLALGVVVLGVRLHGLGDWLAAVTPTQDTFGGLLGAAVLAAVLANLVNNLPATLLLVPLVAGSPALVLAVLVGVNVGPNLTYSGSLATLLWRRVLHAHETRPAVGEFVRLGLLTVPLTLLGGTGALWLALGAAG